jgi:hypothetical protein
MCAPGKGTRSGGNVFLHMPIAGDERSAEGELNTSLTRIRTLTDYGTSAGQVGMTAPDPRADIAATSPYVAEVPKGDPCGFRSTGRATTQSPISQAGHKAASGPNLKSP